MPFQPQIFNLATTDSNQPIVNVDKTAAALIVNVGGQTYQGPNGPVTLPGPDTAILTGGAGTGAPNIALLPPGAAVAFPCRWGPVYARAANSATALSVVIGITP